MSDDAQPRETRREHSPFGDGGANRGNRWLRWTGYGALFAATALTVYGATRDSEASLASAHDHAAMVPSGEAGPVRLDADAARRIGVTFAVAMLDSLSPLLRATGQLTWDETRVRVVAPRFDGWIERLQADFTGREVRAGEPLLHIYSPMLVAAQEELLLAARLARDVAGGGDEARRNAADLLASGRRRLLFWDIPAAEIDHVLETGTVTRTFTLRSPTDGVIIEKAVLAGQRVMSGETLFRVADLGAIWVEAQIFERDIGEVRMGTRAEVEVAAYPGERWSGTVTYLYPSIDAVSRTARMRVELRNPGRRLKPGMYATIRLRGATRPHVVTIPRTAVLATGERVIAFVKRADGQLEPREIRTGLATDDRIEVLSGIAVGDTVVASATFLIDGESNLGAAMNAVTKETPGSKPNAPGPHPNHDDQPE